MALNSFITKDGMEMGRAQVMQAEACQIDPDCRMNPILLKPTSDEGSQVIINGEVYGNFSAKDFYEKKDEFRGAVKEAFDSLAAEYDVIVLEGAGSPAEINLKDNDLVITADTVVIIGNEVLGKPKDEEDAKRMLRLISGKTHQVVTGVCLTTTKQQRHFSVSTDVTFKNLPENEINYYITKYKPFDKAGAYGIQEWIGYVAVEAINGSFYNVMGLPVRLLYQELKKF